MFWLMFWYFINNALQAQNQTVAKRLIYSHFLFFYIVILTDISQSAVFMMSLMIAFNFFQTYNYSLFKTLTNRSEIALCQRMLCVSSFASTS